jgi:hypothetical protein
MTTKEPSDNQGDLLGIMLTRLHALLKSIKIINWDLREIEEGG